MCCLNLYLISQDKNTDKDHFDSAVVCAKNEYDAKGINPYGGRWGRDNKWSFGWANHPRQVKVQFLGIAGGALKEGQVIVGSYVPCDCE